MPTPIRFSLIATLTAALACFPIAAGGDVGVVDIRQGDEPEHLTVLVKPTDDGRYAVSVRSARGRPDGVLSYTLTLEVNGGSMRGMQIELPMRSNGRGFESGRAILPATAMWYGVLELFEQPGDPEGRWVRSGGSIYRIDLSSFIGLGRHPARALLHGHDRNERATQEVMETAEQVFANEQLIGRSRGEISGILGPPHKTATIADRTVWTYHFHDGERDLIRNIWFDIKEGLKVWAVEPIEPE
jgi:hypothetical protein